MILRLKEGVNLGNVADVIGTSIGAALQKYIQLTDTIKVQRGFIRQFGY